MASLDSLPSMASALPIVPAIVPAIVPTLPPISVFSEEQTAGMALFAKGKNIFLTGPGGTGKSFLIKKMVEHAKNTKKACQVCALTGCAAVLLDCNANTIHSWSGVGIMNGLDEDVIRRVQKKQLKKDNWKCVNILIIDEVSMMSKRMFELLDTLGQRIRGNKEPFGGIQIVFVGDFFQLPPIDKDGFCFESKRWFDIFPKSQHLELKTFFRQKDPMYIDILMKVRKGALDKESILLLENYVARDRDTPITKVVPTRKQADYINSSMFEKLKEQERSYDVIIQKEITFNLEDGKPLDPMIIRMCHDISEQEKDREIEAMLNNHHLSPSLKLKIGTHVMCVRNVSLENNIVNGTQGTIVEFVKDRPVVLLTDGRRIMFEKASIQSMVYPTITVEQFPLILAWAVTIHKIQGSSLEKAQIDIGNSIFEYGQTYVALSRVKTMEGLYLMNFQPNRIKTNPKVIAFYDSL
jgi:ATP-dependent DNA helicase PIF1